MYICKAEGEGGREGREGEAQMLVHEHSWRLHGAQ